MEERKVYIVCYDTQEGTLIYHIASSKEKAKEWIRNNHPKDNMLDIEEWVVDDETDK